MSSKVQTNKAPAAIGPYSQAMVVGNLIFTSGQIPLNPETGLIEGNNITEQTHRVCKNLKAVLEAAGASLWRSSTIPDEPSHSQSLGNIDLLQHLAG